MVWLRLSAPAGSRPVRGAPWLTAGFAALAAGQVPAMAQAPGEAQLPAPTSDPLRIDFEADPILRLSDSAVSFEEFHAIVSSAVALHPARLESAATYDEAEAALAEARERQYPSGEVTVTHFQTLAREFSNDPFNIIERSRPTERTDASLRLQQTVWDFGAASRRVEAAGARLRAASAGQESVAEQLALQTIATWYDVAGYQALTAVSEEFAIAQETFRDAVRERIAQGLAAEGDLASAESYIASADTRLAQMRRALAQAEARYTELTGLPPSSVQARAPQLGGWATDRDLVIEDARFNPQVRAAEAQADAARLDARAVRGEQLPNVSAGIDAGRYGVFENDGDYDVRASVTLRYRLFGGALPRVDQADARARAVEARADRIREEAERDAAVAWSDVQALETELAALREAYIAARRSRDVLFERFRASRGTLFDVLAANDAYFETAVAYVQALSELDAARYVLLARRGRLLEALGIDATPYAEARS